MLRIPLNFKWTVPNSKAREIPLHKSHRLRVKKVKINQGQHD
jgi:hypothetical protein